MNKAFVTWLSKFFIKAKEAKPSVRPNVGGGQSRTRRSGLPHSSERCRQLLILRKIPHQCYAFYAVKISVVVVVHLFVYVLLCL